MRIFSKTSRRNNIHSALLLSCALVVLADSASAANISINVASGDAIETGQLTGTTSFTKTGTGTLTLTPVTPNNYVGDTIINGGTLALGDADGLTSGAGDITMADTTTLKSTVEALNTGKAITLSGGGTIDVTALAVTLSGIVTTPNLAKTLEIFGNSVTLSGANSWGAASTLKVNTVTTLTLAAANNIVGATLLVKDGGTIVLTGGVTYAPTSIGVY